MKLPSVRRVCVTFKYLGSSTGCNRIQYMYLALQYIFNMVEFYGSESDRTEYKVILVWSLCRVVEYKEFGQVVVYCFRRNVVGFHVRYFLLKLVELCNHDRIL